MKLPNHTSLKEWSSAIDAIARGEQVILIRKGGIADPTFGLEADRFYLYPTYFHQPDAAPRDGRITIRAWAEVVRTWRVHEVAALEKLAPLVVFSPEALAERYRFRPDQALHVFGIRAWRLPQPHVIEDKAEYAGCRSWISIDDEIDVDGSERVLGASELASRLDAIDALLGARG